MRRRAAARPRGVERITMLLENNPYPQDVRVRSEAESLVAAGHSVEVVAPLADGQPRRELVNGVSVRRFRAVEPDNGGPAGLALEYVVAMLALHLEAVRALLRGATVLHLHNPPDVLFPAGALFRLAGRRVVFDHHDLAPELVLTRFGPGPLATMARLCERLTFAVASHVLAANESHEEIARERGRIPAGRVTVVRNGPATEWIRLPQRTREGSLAPVRLAYLGAIAEQDGVDGLAGVLARLSDLDPPLPATLTVIGDGDGRGALEDALARAGVASMVTIAGWVPLERVPELISEADVCLDPAPSSELNERSTMIKLAEYLALGKPVVAYDLLETRRTVADAALLAPAGDVDGFAERIATLARDPELRSRLANRARERARELTWDRSEVALLAAYARLGRDRDGHR